MILTSNTEATENKVEFLNYAYSPLPERPRLSLRTINRIQSGMLVRKCISGEKSDIVVYVWAIK